MKYEKSITGYYMTHVKSVGLLLIWWVYKFAINILYKEPTRCNLGSTVY